MGARQRGIVALLAALMVVAVTARLGAWQLDRAAQKNEMKRSLDERGHLPALMIGQLAHDGATAATQHYRTVRLSGRWLGERSVYLENRPLHGRVGFIVITPLLLDQDAGAVIVQRGWFARDPMQRTRLPEVPTPSGGVTIVGSVAAPPSRLFEFSGPPATGPIRQNLDLAEFARETALELRPLSILQADDAGNRGDGLVRQWPRPAFEVHKHYGYAAQWFALAALTSGLYVWFQLIRPRLHTAR
ncbi:MAG: SURF1 family protein [Burkholderiaceae bacterium]